MRRIVLVLALVLTAAVPSAAAAVPSAAAAVGRGANAGRYIVVLKRSVAAPGAVAAEHARTLGADVRFVYRHALVGYAATLPTARLRALRADDRVAYVAADRVVHALAQTTPTGVRRIGGEDSSALSGNGSGSVNVDVAIIDTGIDVDHPDLNVVGGRNCANGRGFDDGNGHGTHVAGTAAARDNSIGVVGVAPGARLHAVRVLNNSGSGSFSMIVCGIDYVTANARTIEVANMSFGGPGSDSRDCGRAERDAMHQAICASVRAGVTYVAAAGNESDTAADHVPAAYDEVVTVSALADFDGRPGGIAAPTCRADRDDTFAAFSNFGADVDVIAPGVCITSTYKGGRYAVLSGTSMATPHAAGAAALYLSRHSAATPAEVRSALRTAGTFNWNDADDPDSTQEPLVNVGGF